jgi:hypothetical protein
MTDPVKPARLFAKGFIKLQEPPKIDVEPWPDGSIRVLPGDMSVGSTTDTATVIHNSTTTSNETTTHGGTSTGTSTGTTTSGAVQVGGKSVGAIISGWDVRETEFPPSMDPGSLNFELAPGPEALGAELESLEVDLEEAPQVKREIVDIFGNPGTGGWRAGGVHADNDSDSDDDGDTDSESDEDSAGDSDSASESDSDVDASGEEGVIVPFDALGVQPPFSRE